MASVQLGLIGAGIARSWAPRLHIEAGRLEGLDVRYALRPLDPQADLQQAFAQAIADGLVGVNVTHPFKELAAALVEPQGGVIHRLGAVNTVRFGDRTGHLGFNTDRSGFVRAYRRQFGHTAPGSVCLVGAGGVGRSVAFALVELNASALTIFDLQASKAQALATAVRGFAPNLEVTVFDTIDHAVSGADGVANCTPVGMYQYPGTPVPAALLSGRSWAFDAVYTPMQTTFLTDAQTAGLARLSGYELFFYQGLDAFYIFTGRGPNEDRLREVLDRALLVQPH